MKKFFTKIASLALGAAMAVGVGVAVGSKKVSAAHADSVNFTVGTDSGSTTLEKSPISVSTTSGTFSRTDNYRVYANNSMTVSCSSGNITGMEFTISQNTFTADVGTWDNSSKSWSGSAASVTLSASGGQVRFTTFTVTYAGSGPVTSYTITYDANGGTGTMEDTTNTVADCTFTAPSGKVFSTWNTSANGSGTDVAPGTKVTEDTDLFAIWVDKPLNVTLDKIGTSAAGAYSATLSTVDIVDGTDTYTLNYVNGKKQNDAMILQKSSGAFISNHTAVPGDITSVVLYINSGASGSATYDVAFGTSEYTTATSGVGAVNIAGGNNHEYANSSVTGARYFCVTLGAAYNGQVLKIVVNYATSDPDKQTLQINANGTDYDSATMNYSVGSALFYAKDEDNNDVTVASSWAISDSSIATLALNGNGIPYVTFVKGGTVTITATHPDYNAGTFSLTINVGELSTVVVSGSMSKTSYYVGEVWSPDGLTVTANYEYGYHGDVTSEVTWSYDPAAPALNVNSVVATASFGGKSGSSSSQSVSVSRTNPIQVLYTQESGASVDVYGYYVGFLDGTGPVIMDGDYGIVVYNKSADVSGYTANETILHVTGSISIYKGLYEIGFATMSIASGTFDYPDTPVVYSTTGNETYDYAARLTTVTGTPTLVSGSFDSAAGTADITMSFAVGTKSVQVFYKMAAQTADADAFAAVKDAVANSTEITVKGFTGWYNGFQVQMNGYIPAAVDYTAEDFAQDLLDQTDAVCTGYEEGDNNHDALVAIWSNLASNDKYPSLPSDQKTILAEAERDESGTVVEQAMARYDFLTGKYSLSNFINGRTPIVPAGSYVPSYENNLSSSSSIAIIVIVAVASMTLLGVTLVIRKRKMN